MKHKKLSKPGRPPQKRTPQNEKDPNSCDAKQSGEACRSFPQCCLTGARP